MMKKFRYLIKDQFYNMTLEGEMVADNKEKAEKAIRSIYSIELDTTEEEVNITLLKEIK